MPQMNAYRNAETEPELTDILVYAIPVILLVQGILKSSTGLVVTFVFGTLTILTTVVRFASLKIGTGQENLVCKSSVLQSWSPA